jgi:protein required for attachment to host cells
METVWVVVCDAAHARVFELRNDASTWHPVEAFEHEASRQKSSDLATDRLGQRSSEGASVHHGALAPSSSPKEVEKAHFAHSIATGLDQALRQNRFNHWVLVAPPHFVGMINGEVTTQVKKHLLNTVGKDLTRLSTEELSATLKDDVQVPLDQRH